MAKFQLGDRVTKTKGSKWTGRVVGTYATDLTAEGYAVESETEKGSVQIYPAAALEHAPTSVLSGRKVQMAEYTTGHCPNHNQPGGCQLHNLQCGWPNCDRRQVQHQPAAAASVSERARFSKQVHDMLIDLRAASSIGRPITGDELHELEQDILRALEQALTQQRGAEWSDDLRAVLDAASEASQVPLMWLANQDFSPEQTKAWLCEAVDATVEEGAFSGSLHQVAEEGTGHVVAFTGCGPKSAANAKFLIWCVHFILKHRDALATTPQPSADAVRELVQRWRDREDAHEQNALHACSIGLKESADSMDEKARALRGFADELESLLSGGSHA